MSTARPQGAGKRLLLIAYHFPPSTAVGALRWDKLARVLADDGWHIDVLTLEPSQLSRRDDARLASLPPAIRVVGVRHDTPTAERLWNWVARVTRRLRSAGATGHRRVDTSAVGATVPSPSRGATGSWRSAINARLHVANELSWVNRVVTRALRLARDGDTPYDAVITSGPPHFIHVAGLRLASALGIRHVADFRDPWSLAENVPLDLDSTAFHALTAHHEGRVVANAAAIVMNTEAAAEAMQRRYPHRSAQITYVMNGSDPEDARPSPVRRRFTISYAGSLYLQRDPRVLFRACAPIVQEDRLTPEAFALEFLGSDQYDGRPIRELAADFGLQEHVIVRGMVPRAEALAAAAAATLLVCLPDGQRLTIPAKLFEYVQLDAWLLAFAEPGSAMAMALAPTDADVVTPGDVERATRVIRTRWEAFRSGTMPHAVDAAGRLNRRAQAARLLSLLNRTPAPRSTSDRQRALEPIE